MKANTTTLAIKARMANYIRKSLYGRERIENFSEQEKNEFLKSIFNMYLEMHNELNAYKQKRKDKAALLAKRKASPQTRSMKKKLGLIPKTPKINLEIKK